MEDAEASLGTDHVIFQSASRYVDSLVKQLLNMQGVPYSVSQGERIIRMIKESHKHNEIELLRWADVDC